MELLAFLILIADFAGGYFLIKFISRKLVTFHKYIRFLVESFFYALFFGIGIMASGGHPGFALPAPNLIAIMVMLADGLDRGIFSGLVILLCWWMSIFLFIFFRNLFKKDQNIT